MEQKQSPTGPAEESASEQLLPPYQANPELPNAVYPPLQDMYGYPVPKSYGIPYGQNFPQGQVPVIVQPSVYTPLTQPFPDYLWYSVFVMSCCCLPLGIAALVHSISARDANMYGQRQVAERSSRCARILNHTGLVIGIIALIACCVIAYYSWAHYSRILDEILMKDMNR